MPDGGSSDTKVDDEPTSMAQSMPNGDGTHHEIVESSAPSLPLTNGTESRQDGNPPLVEPPRVPKRKRRRGDPCSENSTVKALSPPWKSAKSEGPSSFIKDGRRVSSRTNTLPLEMLPKGAKATTRSSLQRNSLQRTSLQRPSLQRSQLSKSVQTEVTPAPPVPRGRGRPRKIPQELNGTRKEQKNSPSIPTAKYAKANGVRSKPITTPKATPTRRHKRYLSGDSLHEHTNSGHRPKHRRHQSPRYSDDDTPEYSGASDRGEYGVSWTLPKDLTPNKSPLLRLRYTKPPIPVLNPKQLVPARKYESLLQWSEQDDPLEGEDESWRSEVKVQMEARSRNRVEAALLPGGVLSEDQRSKYTTILQSEPSQQYGHIDHLLAHVKDLQPRLEREKKEHMLIAKKLAHAAAAKYRDTHKTEEQKQQEFRLKIIKKWKEVKHELLKTWEYAGAEAKKARMLVWQEEEQARGTRELDSILEKKTQLLRERQRGLLSRTGSDGDATEELDMSASNDNSDDDNSGTDSEEDDRISESSGTSEDNDVTDVDNDDDLTAEQLREKYKDVPNDVLFNIDGDQDFVDSALGDEIAASSQQLTPTTSPQGDNKNSRSASPDLLESDMPDAQTFDLSQVKLEEVADELMDDSDESSDSGTEQSESEDGSAEGGSEDEEQEDDVGLGLFGFFGKPARNAMVTTENDNDADEPNQDAPVPGEMSDAFEGHTNEKAADEDNNNRDHKDTPGNENETRPASPTENRTSIATSDRISAAATTSLVPSDAESTTSVEPTKDQGQHRLIPPNTQDAHVSKLEVPPLLRGTLREYQHYGLEWLAGLYANNTNGILADEMGLGKTIQTISLLAHLAVEHHIWGPHLIVVPTSVILNWVVEFKRWCPGFKVLPYYGTQKERDAKRKGWSDDSAWNVCITSYQLALQDVKSLKRKNWHYMVLDEAHNIKNFRSKRWETLLTFKTEARLLLTGTPLQNNLTELWSLLFFIEPGNDGVDGTNFSDLQDFNRMFKRPADAILEHGREAMDEAAKETVAKLHQILRPHLLRRLKQDVEKQMPPKFEHVIACRLSKRQRQLYDGYMRRTDTRAKLTSGNYMSMINVLMQLRKVCNHPDLFETRPIVTSLAMKKSAIAHYEVTDLLLRRRLMKDDSEPSPSISLFKITSQEHLSRHEAYRTAHLAAVRTLHNLAWMQRQRLQDDHIFDASRPEAAIMSLEETCKHLRLDRLASVAKSTEQFARHGNRPIYGRSLLESLNIFPASQKLKRKDITDSYMSTSASLGSMMLDLPERCQSMETAIRMFGCITPTVVALGMSKIALGREIYELGRLEGASKTSDSFHEARTRLSIAFPDKSLVQYDCGKLQRLDVLLRHLQDGGHRALIFTQMTKVLDILEQFLNLHGYRYLRLDGSTKLEQRQIMTERFNNDPRIPVMILSSRSGGLGINLTGADSVIFYDLDWNPAMDKQCQDRCHRIGQTREVHIYRFVSTGTIELNILRKSNQKRQLDDVLIQEGDFTTENFNSMNLEDMFEVAAEEAMEKVLEASDTGAVKILEEAEDQEDSAAARVAQLEAVQDEDAADFDEKIIAHEGDGTPKGTVPSTPLDRRESLGTPLGNPGVTPASGATPVPQNPPTPLEAAPQLLGGWTGVDIASRLRETAEERAILADAESRQLLHAWMIPMQLWELRERAIGPRTERMKKKPKKGLERAIQIRR